MIDLSPEQRRAQVSSLLLDHLSQFFTGHTITTYPAPSSRVLEALPRFHVAAIAPGPKLPFWSYCSLGSWETLQDDLTSIEFLIISPYQSSRPIDLLAMLAYYHAFNGGTLGLGHTVPIDEPWLEESACDHFLISHPYPFGPIFEHCHTEDFTIHLLWALPITQAERAFKRQQGLEALEQRFDDVRLAYWEPSRASVIEAIT